MRIHPSYLLHLFALITPLLAVDDADRLGQFYTALPLYRSGAGTNVLPVGVGTPPQMVNLTLTTNSEFILVTTEDCDACVSHAEEYNLASSNSYDTAFLDLQYTMIYPVGSKDTLEFGGSLGQDILSDPRGDTGNPRPIASIDRVTRDSQTVSTLIVKEGTNERAVTGQDVTLSDGTSGFWGLGIYQDDPRKSIIPSVMTQNNDGAPNNNMTYFTVGFNISSYRFGSDIQAGVVHWGGAPTGAYTGSFNWIEPDTTKAASWAVKVDRMRVEGHVIDTSRLYGSLDPGFDLIYVPTAVAEEFYREVDGAARDSRDSTRWNLVCDANISMTVTLAGHEYDVDKHELVQPRDASGRTCWGSVVAWQNGSVPESLGEIRFGTPFMSGIYSVLYHDASGQLVGIAGKPGSVNDFNVRSGDGKVNTKLAGILIGSLLAALFIFFVLCYARNRSSFQSRWYRAIRRQHRFHTNAIIRGATIPPIIPPMAPVMPMGPGMMPPMGPGMMPPMGPGPMAPYPGVPPQAYGWAPPPYQGSPNQHSQTPHQPPQAIDAAPSGFYSPRSRQSHPAAIPISRAKSSRSPKHHSVGSPRHLSQSAPLGHPPESSRSIRWGPVATHNPHVSDSSQVGGGFIPKDHPPQPGKSDHPSHPGPSDRPNPDTSQAKKYDDWLRKYGGAGQGSTPYPDPGHPYPRYPNPPTQPVQMSTSAPPAPGYIPGLEKRFPWSRSFKGTYSPVHHAGDISIEFDGNPKGGSPEKRRLGFGQGATAERESLRAGQAQWYS